MLKTTDTIEKVHYNISEVAKICNVATSFIRFYEGKFRHIKPKRRDKNGNRIYTKKELQKVQKIVFMANRGLSVEGIKRSIEEDYFEDLYQAITSKVIKA